MYFGNTVDKSKGLIQINQAESLMSPKVESNDQAIGKILKQRFDLLHERQKMAIIKNSLHNLYGRHSAIPYKKDYNFQQRWQQMTDPNYLQGRAFLLKTENTIFTVFYISVLVLYIITIWFLSIYRIFKANSIFYPFLGLILITQIADALFKSKIGNETIDPSQLAMDLKNQIKMHWIGLLFLPYLTLLILQENLATRENSSAYRNILMIPIDLIFVWLSYNRYKDIYSMLKIKILASKYRYEMQIIELVGRCLSLVHIFGILLFLVSLLNNEINWTKSVIQFNRDWLHRYGYSLYFSCTTTFTIGYGDITPKNIIEIFTIMIVQMLGVINFGFIITQIGRIMAKISQSQEVLYKNISEAEKMGDNYKLPESLVQQMRTYIINNQIANSKLNIQEQDNFMRKLNDQIRESTIFFYQDVQTLNKLRIIKSSVFFICHWSKKFQQNIANKLVRAIYSPQETLHQIKGKQKIYIVARGKVDIQACLSQNSDFRMRKPLKTIEFLPEKEVQFNVFGYSALISGLNINLKAVVRDHSICYLISKEDILETMVEDDQDFEYFHQIKRKIQQSFIKELWQAPSINNTRQHYLPNNFYILKKAKLKDSKTNSRRAHIRSQKRMKAYIETRKILQDTERQEEKSSSSSSQQQEESLIIKHNSKKQKQKKQKIELNTDKSNTVLSAMEREAKYNSQPKCMITNRHYNTRRIKKNTLIQKQVEMKDKKAIINNMDYIKIFRLYNPKNNGNKLFDIYNKKFCKLPQNKKSSTFHMLDTLTEGALLKLITCKQIGHNKLED